MTNLNIQKTQGEQGSNFNVHGLLTEAVNQLVDQGATVESLPVQPQGLVSEHSTTRILAFDFGTRHYKLWANRSIVRRYGPHRPGEQESDLSINWDEDDDSGVPHFAGQVCIDTTRTNADGSSRVAVEFYQGAESLDELFARLKQDCRQAKINVPATDELIAAVIAPAPFYGEYSHTVSGVGEESQYYVPVRVIKPTSRNWLMRLIAGGRTQST